MQSRERTIIGLVSYRNRYWCIVSNRIGFCCILQLISDNRLHYTGWSKDIRAPSPLRARPPHDKGGGCRGGRQKKTVTWHLLPLDTKTMQYWVLVTSDRWRSTSRKWYQQSTVSHSNVSANYPVLKLTERASWFVADGLHVPPIAYKLHSLSHLPGLILQVAGTPTQGVLVLDRIGAFPCRPFSSAEQTLTILAKTPA